VPSAFKDNILTLNLSPFPGKESVITPGIGVLRKAADDLGLKVTLITASLPTGPI
jgi:hypothetical protein